MSFVPFQKEKTDVSLGNYRHVAQKGVYGKQANPHSIQGERACSREEGGGIGQGDRDGQWRAHATFALDNWQRVSPSFLILDHTSEPSIWNRLRTFLFRYLCLRTAGL